jgi:hypothetical protein
MGKSFSIQRLDESERLQLCQLIFHTCGIIREDQYVGYIVSLHRIKPSSTATVGRPQWIDSLVYEEVCGLPPDYMIFRGCARVASDTPKIERAPQRSRECLEAYVQRQMERLADLIRANWTSRVISEELHLSLATVTEAKNMMGQGKEIPVRLPRGRPSKLTPEIVRQVHSATTEDPYLGSRRQAQLIAQATGMSIPRRPSTPSGSASISVT